MIGRYWDFSGFIYDVYRNELSTSHFKHFMAMLKEGCVVGLLGSSPVSYPFGGLLLRNFPPVSWRPGSLDSSILQPS